MYIYGIMSKMKATICKNIPFKNHKLKVNWTMFKLLSFVGTCFICGIFCKGYVRTTKNSGKCHSV